MGQTNHPKVWDASTYKATNN